MGLERINDFKKESNITNEELAALSGVPKSTIDKITAGKTYDPKLETIKAIVRALGKTLDDLDDSPFNNKKSAAPLTPAAQRIGRAYEIADKDAQGIVELALKPYLTANNVEKTENVV